MKKYIIKRVLIIFPTLLAITFLVFGVMNLTPGDPAQAILGDKATDEAIVKLNHELGYDKPFIIRYLNYAADIMRGDMGNSYRNGSPVLEEIISRLPTTAALAFVSIIISVMIGVPLGILAAVKQYSIFDIVGTASAMIMASVPGFWFGLMAILVFSLKLGLLPSNGSDTWVHYILPAVTLSISTTASLLRLTRTTMLETVRQDYVRTARSKGQSESKVIFKHALKNALLPVVTVAGMQFGFLFGGAIIVEAVFSINGVGTLLVNAIRMKDIPLATGCTLVLAFLFMLIMLVVDILYAFIDPRIRTRYQRG